MRAIVLHKYGSPDVLHLKEVEKPTVKYKEVLIRIYTTTVTPGDCEIRRFKSVLANQPPFTKLVRDGGIGE